MKDSMYRDVPSGRSENNVSVEKSSFAISAARRFCQGDGDVTLTEKKAALNRGIAVTVICITYNHEAFLAEALDSFVRQRTKFRFQIFVGDDKSTDSTASILRRYAEQYPDLIVPFIRDHNMGAQRNLIDLCQRAESPYLAFCEGDDYWTDDLKLQKQFDFMEQHSGCNVCFAEAEIKAPVDWHLRTWYRARPDGRLMIPSSIPSWRAKSLLSVADYVRDAFPAHTSTLFYRWNYDLPLPDWYYHGIVGDSPLFLMQAGMHQVGYLPDVVSVYRINEKSIYFNPNRTIHFIKTREDIIRYLSGFYEFALKYYPRYPLHHVSARLLMEVGNYCSALNELDRISDLSSLIIRYPRAASIFVKEFLSTKKTTALASNQLTPLQMRQVQTNFRFWQIGKFVSLFLIGVEFILYRLPRAVHAMFSKVFSVIFYWSFALVPKKRTFGLYLGFVGGRILTMLVIFMNLFLRLILN